MKIIQKSRLKYLDIYLSQKKLVPRCSQDKQNRPEFNKDVFNKY